MKATKSKEKKKTLQSRKIPKNPKKIPKKSRKNPIPTDPVPKPRFLDSSRPNPDRSQNVHPAGL
jgi:hypothetical protein